MRTGEETLNDREEICKCVISKLKGVLPPEDDPNVHCACPTIKKRNGVPGVLIQKQIKRIDPKVTDEELLPVNNLIIEAAVKKGSAKR